jgi:tetratricopeptide (TPR) repeat protein
VLAACIAGGILVFAGFMALRHADPPAADRITSAPDAAIAVLPVAVANGEEWAWLRLGLMDLIATRLRRGGQAVVASDNVVALLRSERIDVPVDTSALRELTGARYVAAPAAERVADEWQVRIELRGADGSQREVRARGPDPIGAASEAGDRLLVLLGHAPPADGEGAAPLSQAELQQRIEAALLGDDFAGARRLVERAPEALRDSPPIRLRLAQIEFRSGDFPAARARLEQLLASTSAADDAVLRAGALFMLGAVEVRDDRSPQALQAFDEAIELAESGREPRVLGQAYTGRAAALVNLGRFDEAAADLARARIALELAGDSLALARVDANEGVLDNARGRHAEALRILQRAATRFERFGAINDLSLTVAAQVKAHLFLLDADGALAASEGLWRKRAQIGNPRSRGSYELQRARALAASGRIEEARSLLDELDHRLDPADTSGLPGDIASERARLELDAGNFAVAATAARIAVDRLPTLDEAPERARAWLSLGRALLAAGDSGAARTQAAGFERWAGAHADQPTVTLLAALAQAELARAEHRREDAYRSFAAALADAERRTVPRDLVVVAQSYGGSLLEDGEHARASAVIGRVARWSEQDFDCAILQARLYRALGQVEAWRSALSHARALAGERSIPAALLDAPPASRDPQRSTGMP